MGSEETGNGRVCFAGSRAFPPNAVASSPFDAIYHYGTFANTGHVQDYDQWLSDVLAHELRIVTGEFRMETGNFPYSIGWRGLYLLEENADLAGTWQPRAFLRHGVHAIAQGDQVRSFYRLNFSHAYQ